MRRSFRTDGDAHPFEVGLYSGSIAKLLYRSHKLYKSAREKEVLFFHPLKALTLSFSLAQHFINPGQFVRCHI